MKYLIIGAGPAGLTVANKLKENGISDFLVLEREAQAGGLCRSMEVDGAPLDIGGGHFLDVRRLKVNEFLFKFMPMDEWNLYERDSRIMIGDRLIGHPIEANIWQLGLQEQVAYIKSIAAAGCNVGTKMPEKFIDWIYWKLGTKIAEDYMLPYNQKMFGEELDRLGTYWLEKLPNVSFEETLLSCLEKKAYGKQPGHAQFYYPKKYGYGELWLRMADSIKHNIEYGRIVSSIDFATKTVGTMDGQKYRADAIVTTIPWMEYRDIHGMPDDIRRCINELSFTSVQIEYFPEKINTACHWIYYPDIKMPYHRILVRHNFCPNSRGYWTETNSDRIAAESSTEDYFKYMNKYAYPLNTIGKPDAVNRILAWAEANQVYGVGRWGEHSHYNSDVTVMKAMELVDSKNLLY